MALVLNGSSYYTRTTSLSTDLRASTVMAYVQRASTPGVRFKVFNSYLDASNQIEASIDSSNICNSWTGIGGGGSGSTTLSVNTWYHIAINGDGDLFLDGVLEANAGGASFSAPTEMVLGAGDGGGNPLDGKIAYVRAWNAALNATEIAAEMASTTAVRATDLLYDHAFISSAGSGWTSTGSPSFDSDDPLSGGSPTPPILDDVRVVGRGTLRGVLRGGL